MLPNRQYSWEAGALSVRLLFNHAAKSEVVAAVLGIAVIAKRRSADAGGTVPAAASVDALIAEPRSRRVYNVPG